MCDVKDWKLIKIVLFCAVGSMFLLFVFSARLNVMNDFAYEWGDMSLIKFNGIFPSHFAN